MAVDVMTLRYIGEHWTCLIEFTDTGARTRDLGLSADQLNGATYRAFPKQVAGVIEVVPHVMRKAGAGK